MEKSVVQKPGQVSTPPRVVQLMVEKLFQKRTPSSGDSVLDPGCGAGAFIKGILEWCSHQDIGVPHITGIEKDSELVGEARELAGNRATIMEGDFLGEDLGAFDFIICNPPYLRLEEMSEVERERYRREFETAVNRFDLYILFFEKALKALKPSGRMVFITPEKYQYTLTTRTLRKLMTQHHVEEIHYLPEDAFQGLVTYPTITTINEEGAGLNTTIIHRDDSSTTVKLPTDGSRWISVIRAERELPDSEHKLEEVCLRISCGVATGADRVFVVPTTRVPETLKDYAYETVGGRDLTPTGIRVRDRMLIPYDKSGLLSEESLVEFRKWLTGYKDILTARSCVRKGKRKWYAFHENPPMADILKPKLLCKDIAKEPRFWLDSRGSIIPRHSVYYIVPKNPELLPRLIDYLNSEDVKMWLMANCQRAANDYIRLQSSILKEIPLPSYLVEK